MYKIEKTYTDFNGVQKTENFYFNLTTAEVTEMEMTTAGGMSEMIRQIIAANDQPSIIKVFKDLLLKAYGEKNPDGGFYKSDAISNRFAATQAYSDLFMELATDTEAATNFVNGIMPAEAAVQTAQTVQTSLHTVS